MPSALTEPLSYPAPRASACPFDPPPAYREAQDAAPITRVRLWDGSTPWLVTRYADQKALLSDPRLSSDVTSPSYPHLNAASRARRAQASTFITMDDPEHARLRRMVTAPFTIKRVDALRPAIQRIVDDLIDDPEHARLRRMVTAPFTIKRVDALRPAIQRIVDDLIDDLLAGPNPADLVQAFALPVPSLVICRLLGVPYDDHDFFQRSSKKLINRNTPVDEIIAAQRALLEYLDDLVGRKLAEPDDGLLSQLAAQRLPTGELTRHDVAMMGLLLLVAGHETTANMIALGTLALLRHPAQLDLLRAAEDPKVVAGAVEELLRYLNIVHSGRRRFAREDIEIDGQVIKAGDGVVVANDIGNRDPDTFPGNPDELDITRAARRHIAFGFGVHQCLGQPLARVELQVVYGMLYRRIPTLRLATELSSVPFKDDALVYGVYELPVAW